MSLRQVTVGVIGPGKVTDTLVNDCLNEHFAFGPPDAEGYFGKSTEFDIHVLMPVGRDLFTPGIEAVWQWALRCELPFLALSDGSATEMTDQVQESVLDPGDWQLTRSPEKAIVALLKEASNPLLLVCSEEGDLNEDLTAHVVDALTAGIPVYDLARALLEQTWADLGLEPPQQEAEPQGAGQLAVAAPPEAEYVLSGEEMSAVTAALARAYVLTMELAAVAKEFGDLRVLLAAAEQAMKPLAALVAAPLPGPQEPDAEQAEQAEQAPEPPPGTKTRLEVWDAESGEWKAAGRGRPKSGVKTRRVPK